MILQNKISIPEEMKNFVKELEQLSRGSGRALFSVLSAVKKLKIRHDIKKVKTPELMKYDYIEFFLAFTNNNVLIGQPYLRRL